MAELLFKDEVYAIIGAALADRAIPFNPQVPLRIKFKERVLEKTFCADLICFGAVLVELKAINQITHREEARALNYLKATGLRVAVIINFGDPSRLVWIRVVR